jgi:mRNA interferase RelE/StbE
MTLELAISRQALKFIKTLPPKQYKQVLNAVLGLLSNPAPHDSRPLKGDPKGNLRVDIGEYRIIYRVEDETLKVPVIGKRNDDEVYKILSRH